MDETSETELQPSDPSATSPLADPEYLKALRQQMLKFAILQLRDEPLAEEAVQEALVGALKNAKSFGRRAALKTWVFAILRHKITDILRHRQRMVETRRPVGRDDEGDLFDTLFDAKGFWQADQRPASWSQPAEEMVNAQFWRVFDSCLNGLPETPARIFMMREFLELESADICKMEAITTSNLHVILHRARLRLRECLENNWFLESERI